MIMCQLVKLFTKIVLPVLDTSSLGRVIILGGRILAPLDPPLLEDEFSPENAGICIINL